MSRKGANPLKELGFMWVVTTLGPWIVTGRMAGTTWHYSTVGHAPTIFRTHWRWGKKLNLSQIKYTEFCEALTHISSRNLLYHTVCPSGVSLTSKGHHQLPGTSKRLTQQRKPCPDVGPEPNKSCCRRCSKISFSCVSFFFCPLPVTLTPAFPSCCTGCKVSRFVNQGRWRWTHSQNSDRPQA